MRTRIENNNVNLSTNDDYLHIHFETIDVGKTSTVLLTTSIISSIFNCELLFTQMRETFSIIST